MAPLDLCPIKQLLASMVHFSLLMFEPNSKPDKVQTAIVAGDEIYIIVTAPLRDGKCVSGRCFKDRGQDAMQLRESTFGFMLLVVTVAVEKSKTIP